MMKRLNTLLCASLISMLGVGLLVGGTYALFTSKATVTNHLKAGNLNISLIRTKYSKTVLNTDGYLETKEDNNELDFTSASSKNIFGLEENELIVPTSKFSADLTIKNGKKDSSGAYIKSSVAFTYSASLVLDESSDTNLANQLQVTVKQGETSTTKRLNEFNDIVLLSGEMKASDDATSFTISLEFLNLDSDGSTNNKAQDKEVSFDLVVEAIQKTTAGN